MKSPWLTVFDHRFLDPTFANCRHLPGQVLVSTPPPEPVHERHSGGERRYHASFDGDWLRFVPDEPLREVIGTEVRLRFRLRDPLHDRIVHTILWGGDWSVMLNHGRLEVVCGGEATVWQNFPATWQGFPAVAGPWIDLAWSWRVDGQSLLRAGGTLVAARPGVAAGVSHDLKLVWVGSDARFIDAIPPAEPVWNPLLHFPGDIAWVRVAVLTRGRAEGALDEAFPVAAKDAEKLEPCRAALATATAKIGRLFRQLMATVMSQENPVWNSPDVGEPIGARARKLHVLAEQAARALVPYLDGDDEALVIFRARLDAFLRLLAEVTGTGAAKVAQQAAKEARRVKPPEDCAASAKEVRDRYPREIKRLERLFTAVDASVEKNLGVHWHD